MWAFFRSSSFEEGCLLAANLGNDADTTAAIYGQIAGAFYGADAIPEEWKRCIVHSELIIGFADKLLKLCTKVQHTPLDDTRRD